MLLILGTGRSGSKYITKVMQASGLDFGHEKIKQDGGSGWPLLRWVPAMKMNQEMYRSDLHILHQIRSPLKCISSMMTFSEIHWNILRDCRYNFSNHKIKRCMQYYYYWNKACREQATYSYYLEELENKEIREKIEDIINKKINWTDTGKKVNARYHVEFTWEDLDEFDKELNDKIKNMDKEIKTKN